MADTALKVVHIYERDASKFEADLNAALQRIVDGGGVVGDIKYASDPATSENRLGGFCALVIYEQPVPSGG